LRVQLQAVAPVAAAVEAAVVCDLPGDVQVVLPTRLIAGSRMVVLAPRMEARRRR
jgi:hypothetical protein